MEKKDEFLELVKQFESLKELMVQTREKLDVVCEELGVGNYIQDPNTGLVYKIARPEGTFVHFHKIGYVRTAKADERQGTLSKKEAESMGFILRK